MIEEFFKTSLLEEKYKNFLNDTNIKAISFDIFDTLFFRQCDLPETIFKLVGGEEIVLSHYDSVGAFVEYRKEAEKKARQNKDKNEDITLIEIYDMLDLPSGLKSQIMALELKHEMGQLVVNPQLQRWIDMAKDVHKEVVLISDMYLSQIEIEEIALSKLPNRNKISKIFMSSDYKKTKATGNLFREVAHDLSLDHHQLLHIGDNKRSDFVIPRNLGIHALYYGFDENIHEINKLEAGYVKTNLFNGADIRRLSCILNPYEEDLQQFFFNTGSFIFGPLMWEFCHWMHSKVSNLQLEQLYFIMREGGIFQKYYLMLYPETETKLLYASRKSTLAIILDASDIGSVNFSMFRGFTIEDLYKSFFLAIEDVGIKKNRFVLCEDAKNILLDKSTLFEKVIDDLERRSKNIGKQITIQKKLLSKYLEFLEINKTSAFVDFGARGTIFSRLNYAIKEKNRPKTNLLFFQNKQGYDKQLGNHTLSFLPYGAKTKNAIEAMARSPEFIEVLLNLDNPTTICYQERNGLVEPNIFLPNCNSSTMKYFSDAFQKGIDTFFSVASACGVKEQTYNREWLGLVFGRMVELPTKWEAQYFGNFEYDEGRGSGHFYTIVDNDKTQEILKVGIEKFYKQFLQNPAKYRYQFPWPEGVITTIEPNFLKILHGMGQTTNQHIVDELIQKIISLKLDKVVIYGAGEIFEELSFLLEKKNIVIEAVADTRAEVKEFDVRGYKIQSLKNILQNKNALNIVIASGVFADKIEEYILKNLDASSKISKIIRC